MIIHEDELNKIIKRGFNSKILCIKLRGIINGNVKIIRSFCNYNRSNGILIISDLLNKFSIDITSQYIMEYHEKSLKIKLDNGQNVELIILKK